MAEPADPDAQLEELCRVLNYFNVGYIVFGSHVARLNEHHRHPRAAAGHLRPLRPAGRKLSPRIAKITDKRPLCWAGDSGGRCVGR